MSGQVVAIFISPEAGAPMQRVHGVNAIQGAGLQGDRYAVAKGSYNRGTLGKRQVTFINARFFEGTDLAYAESRRNIVVKGVELMWLIGKEFRVGTVLFRGVKYCDPCERPSKLAGTLASFKEEFSDCGGLLAEVVEGGFIQEGDPVIPPSKNY